MTYNFFPEPIDPPRWCPVCVVVLKPFERHGIELDFCPQCHGIWLDEGKLDSLLEKAGSSGKDVLSALYSRVPHASKAARESLSHPPS